MIGGMLAIPAGGGLFLAADPLGRPVGSPASPPGPLDPPDRRRRSPSEPSLELSVIDARVAARSPPLEPPLEPIICPMIEAMAAGPTPAPLSPPDPPAPSAPSGARERGAAAGMRDSGGGSGGGNIEASRLSAKGLCDTGKPGE